MLGRVGEVSFTTAQSDLKFEQGIISHFFDALCFPEWEPRTNRVTYRLYRGRNQDHITPIERIPICPRNWHAWAYLWHGQLATIPRCCGRSRAKHAALQPGRVIWRRG
jgi:hypothetical protein